jgi:hypothetical protein
MLAPYPWLSPTLWNGPLVGRLPLSKVSGDKFPGQLDHRGHVAEVDLPPPDVSRGGTQSGGGSGAQSTTVVRGRGALSWAVAPEPSASRGYDWARSGAANLPIRCPMIRIAVLEQPHG